MATVRTASTNWEGDLAHGKGIVHFESSDLGDTDVSWAARSQEAGGKTSPEELIAAAHSSCFSMALSGSLAKAGKPPQTLQTRADVSFDPVAGSITGIHITVRGTVPNLTSEEFTDAAEGAKANCPVSKALTGTTITLDAALA